MRCTFIGFQHLLFAFLPKAHSGFFCAKTPANFANSTQAFDFNNE